MSLTIVDSINVNGNNAARFITGGVVIIPQTVIIEYTGEIPETWGFLGYVYREIQLENTWIVTENSRIIPNRLNLIKWSDDSVYRLAFKLARYIKPGTLITKVIDV